MILTMTTNSRNVKVIDVNFVGNKKDFVECIFQLIKLYKEEFMEVKECK